MGKQVLFLCLDRIVSLSMGNLLGNPVLHLGLLWTQVLQESTEQFFKGTASLCYAYDTRHLCAC